MFELIQKPWPWYVAGPLIGLMVPLLLLLGNKRFGVSSTFRHICAACLPANISFFQYNWKRESWNLFFAGGILLGGIVSAQWLQGSLPVTINPSLAGELTSYGISGSEGQLPAEVYNWSTLFSVKGFLLIIAGGFLVGFGTRYAGGCTSGHSIMGMSNLQWPSLVATCCFMAGGVLVANFVLPYILKLSI